MIFSSLQKSVKKLFSAFNQHTFLSGDDDDIRITLSCMKEYIASLPQSSASDSPINSIIFNVQVIVKCTYQYSLYFLYDGETADDVSPDNIKHATFSFFKGKEVSRAEFIDNIRQAKRYLDFLESRKIEFKPTKVINCTNMEDRDFNFKGLTIVASKFVQRRTWRVLLSDLENMNYKCLRFQDVDLFEINLKSFDLAQKSLIYFRTRKSQIENFVSKQVLIDAVVNAERNIKHQWKNQQIVL
ncbi:hypothetical protein WICMUC_005314 [Wickerhamomyces mucosus]|uniref:Uncharacterized protein n=1 Tax=Wickerhamomyces mucosus TaxID=1378264 RepID=A0A9P8PAH6_9ASCO|nr:hypothetical protein WICMUC_005314 [Wickerhamomyces mucosus]